MRTSIYALGLTALLLVAHAPRGAAQAPAAAPSAQAAARAPDPAAAMRWRSIGPTRAGRARALAGVAGHPDLFYVGFDDGGVWRSSDYGSNWVPLFDQEPTGSIGAIAVAPSNPNVIYVGSGAGIIRPDLATGDGLYKSGDAGRTWTHLGLDSTQMIAMVDVDPTNPDRLFVAALGHPYGPNAERGIFRSTDGGRSFEKVLYRDEYTSGNDVRIDPSDPTTVYAALWQQQEAFWEGGAFGGGSGGIFKSTDGGTTWTQLTDGLPPVLEANLAIAPSNPRVLYAMVAAVGPTGGSGPIGFYRSSDGGAHWTLRTHQPGAPGDTIGTADPRPLARIGGGDLPPITVDPKDKNVVYSASVVMWRTEDGGASWSAVRGAPGGDDYQRIWISPTDPNLIAAVSDQGAVISANRGASWSNWYTQPTAAVYHVTTDDAFPYRVCSGQQDSGSICVDSRSDDGEITFHDWHPVNIQEYGMAAPDPRDPDVVYGSGRTTVSRYDRRTGQTTYVGPDAAARGEPFGRNVRTMPLVWSPVQPDVLYYTSNVVWRSTDHARSWTRISPDLARADLGRAGERGEVREHRDAGPPRRDHRAVALAQERGGALGRHRRRHHPGDDGRRRDLDERHPARDRAVDAHLQHRGGPLRRADRVRRREHDADRRLRIRISGAPTTAAGPGPRSTPASRPAPWPTRSARTPGSRGSSTPPPRRRSGSRSTTAITGSRCGSTCRPSRCATSR